MKNSQLVLILFVFSTLSVFSQKKKKKDIAAIKKMCGCYEVGFNFAETFNFSKDSTYKPSKTKRMKALEWAQLVKEDKNKIVIQHLLVVGNPEKQMVIKHWRQDWLYQNQDLYTYNGDNNWKYQQLPKNAVKGQWTQKVYQVDDSPRYEGSASWVHVDGKSFWENRTDAPLPRREYTTRADYNVTVRGNRHEITKDGWVHDQNNDKVIRETGKEDVLLAQEKGYNTYKRVDDSKCKVAADWWQKNHSKWQLVRTKWDEVFARHKDLSLHAKVKNKNLYKYLFSDEYADKSKIEDVIESFVVK